MDTEQNSLAAVLIQKKEWLSQMLSLTKQFYALLEADQIDEFASALKSREALIGKIDALTKQERQLDAFGNADTNKLKQQTQDMIRDILSLDKKNADLASEKLMRYREQIKNVSQSKKGIDNYAKTGQSEDAYFVDAKK